MSDNPIVRVGFTWVGSKGRYFLVWKDPVTNKRRREQTDIHKRGKKVERKILPDLAGKKQDELNADFLNPDAKMTWDEFCTLYREERLPQKSDSNRVKFGNAVDIFNRVWPRHVPGVLLLERIDARLMLRVESEMKSCLAPGSIDGYIATLRASINWAAKTGLIDKQLPGRPPSDVVQQLPSMRLHPINLEALERMETAANKVMGHTYGHFLADYMRCLWYSGGRLSDPLWMHAYRRDCHRPINLTGDNPQFAWTNRQKNKTDQFAPVFLDFAKWLRERITESSEFLFPVHCETGEIRCDKRISKLISECGRVAGVIAEPGETPKTATAKHLRSSCISRWSMRGMLLKAISLRVRHASEKTTRKYYVAPFDRIAIEKFVESDWIENGDQSGDQNDASKLKYAVIRRGDGGIRTHE